MFRVTDLRGKLPVGGKYRKRSMSGVKYIAVHHSATTSGTPSAFARYHVNERGWPGIGYHYVITKDGSIYLCNDLDTLCYNVSRRNSQVVGICLVGNFNKTPPTDEQYISLSWLIDCLKVTGAYKVKPHSYFRKTSCPGTLFPSVLFDE